MEVLVPPLVASIVTLETPFMSSSVPRAILDLVPETVVLTEAAADAVGPLGLGLGLVGAPVVTRVLVTAVALLTVLASGAGD